MNAAATTAECQWVGRTRASSAGVPRPGMREAARLMPALGGLSRALALGLSLAFTFGFTPLATASAAASTPSLASPAGETQRQFFPFTIDQDLTGAPDVSASTGGNPLTQADRIVRKGPHFVKVGSGTPDQPNGERVKIYGVNLSFAANFPTNDEARKVAKRLRSMGFNGVRLHHLDTKPGQTNPPDSLLTEGPFPTFNPVAVERLRHFIDVLASEGIYVDLNLRVGYPFRPTVDQGIPALGPDNETKPLHVFHPVMRERQAEFATQIIEKLGLADHPALAMVEINNESSLLYAYERGTLNRALSPAYRDELKAQWRLWYKKREPNSVAAFADVGFNAGLAMRTEEFSEFLRDLDQVYLDTLYAVVRKAVTWPVPITGTQMGYGGQHYVASHQNMDYLDEHFYIDHYDFPGPAWSRTDWRILDNDVTRQELDKLAVAHGRRDPQKPWVMSEYNMAYPNQQGAAIMPVVAGLALAGDWDGLYFFDYADGKVWNHAADSFTLSGDPGKLSLTGQSSVLFREGQADWLPADWAYRSQKAPDDVFLMDAPRAAGVIGRVGQNPHTAGPLLLTLGKGYAYATVLLTPLDAATTLGESRHMLLTHATTVRGTEPSAQPPRPKAMLRLDKNKSTLAPDENSDQGPGGPRDATGPMWMERVPATAVITLSPNQPRAGQWQVYPLDEHGRRLAALDDTQVVLEGNELRISLHQNDSLLSPWYELVGQ